MTKVLELSGKTFGKLTVIKRTTLEKRLKTKTVEEAFENIIDSNKNHPKTFEEWK